MESFSITSKCCFRGPFTLPKNISWGITEMLLCTYCVGQSPKMRNGNGFWHYCRDSGMIIILASSIVGSLSESFSFFHSIPPSLCINVFVGLQQEMEIWGSLSGQMPPESPLIFSSPALLCLLALSFSLGVFVSFSALIFFSLAVGT